MRPLPAHRHALRHRAGRERDGGLRDTVTPYDPTTGAGRGFTFQSYNADDFLASIDRALALDDDAPEQFAALAQQDMLVDSSWTLPAKEYMQLYQSVCGG
ncbi:MAG: hypothetical protein V8T01_04160 [Oscillospiraceae bacterium]